MIFSQSVMQIIWPSHEKKSAIGRLPKAIQILYIFWKISFKKLYIPSSKCHNPNYIYTYWIENEHHCLIKFDTRNVPEICRRQNNWNQCPTWPRSHQDLSPEKFPPFLSILSQKKKKKKGKHKWAKTLWNLLWIL